jgi:hypothetical protein
VNGEKERNNRESEGISRFSSNEAPGVISSASCSSELSTQSVPKQHSELHFLSDGVQSFASLTDLDQDAKEASLRTGVPIGATIEEERIWSRAHARDHGDSTEVEGLVHTVPVYTEVVLTQSNVSSEPEKVSSIRVESDDNLMETGCVDSRTKKSIDMRNPTDTSMIGGRDQLCLDGDMSVSPYPYDGSF